MSHGLGRTPTALPNRFNAFVVLSRKAQTVTAAEKFRVLHGVPLATARTSLRN